jgi:hypothetical protein
LEHDDIVEHLVEYITQLKKHGNRKMRKELKIVGIQANMEIESMTTTARVDIEMDNGKLVMN